MISEKRFQRKLEKIKKRGERMKQQKELQDAYVEYLPDRKKRKVSNMMLIIIVFAIVGYVAAAYYMQYHTGIEMSNVVTTCWFSFWTVEIVALAAIKRGKLKNNTDVLDAMPKPEDFSDDEACG